MLPALLRSNAWAIWARSTAAGALTAVGPGAAGPSAARRAAAPLTTAGDGPAGSAQCDDTDASAIRDKLVDAALRHVKQYGWSQAALTAGAKDLGLSPAAAGLLPGGAAGLVAEVIRRHNRQLALELQQAQALTQQQQQRQQEQGDPSQQQQQPPSPAVAALAEALSSPDPARRVAAALRRRLEIGVAPNIDTWPQALAALARPGGGGAAAAAAAAGAAAPRALALLAELADEVASVAAGDAATDMAWYWRRAAVGGVYAATELYMLTDFSPNYQDTWAQLDRRLRDLEALRSATAGAGGAALSLLQWGLAGAGRAAAAAAEGSGRQQQQQQQASGGAWSVGAQGTGERQA